MMKINLLWFLLFFLNSVNAQDSIKVNIEGDFLLLPNSILEIENDIKEYVGDSTLQICIRLLIEIERDSTYNIDYLYIENSKNEWICIESKIIVIRLNRLFNNSQIIFGDFDGRTKKVLQVPLMF